jgi:hypothetical protein
MLQSGSDSGVPARPRQHQDGRILRGIRHVEMAPVVSNCWESPGSEAYPRRRLHCGKGVVDAREVRRLPVLL